MEELLKLSGALYDPTRLQLLRFLQVHGECCVCELEHSLGMIQSRLSRHLRILTEGGFVTSSRNGKWVYYRLMPQSSLHQAVLNSLISVEWEVPLKISACQIKRGEES